MNKPNGIAELYRFATRIDPDDEQSRIPLKEALHHAAIMRESALKGVVFIGVPRTILSLAAMNESFEDDVKSFLRSNSVRQATPENIEAILARGRALWTSIYTPHEDKLHDKLGSYHPDFISFIIQSYGSILAPLPESGFRQGGDSEDVQGNLSRALTSVAGIACLRAEERVGPQLTSHVFGLLKARSIEDQTAEDVWLGSDEGVEWVIRSVDNILDAVAPDGEKMRMTEAKL